MNGPKAFVSIYLQITIINPQKILPKYLIKAQIFEHENRVDCLSFCLKKIVQKTPANSFFWYQVVAYVVKP